MLQERIEQELEENVVLEQVVLIRKTYLIRKLNSSGKKPREAEHDTELLAERELLVDNDHNNEADFERLLEMSQEWSEDNIGAPVHGFLQSAGRYLDRQHDAVANF
ncbi:MAG: hypothetical protein R3C11_14465 [Planctomycetaceae bacterium]